MSAKWRGEQDRCLREIEGRQTADQSYLAEGVRILELARNAQWLFEIQEARQIRKRDRNVVSAMAMLSALDGRIESSR